MSLRLLRLRPELLADLREVTAWYDAACPGLGMEFQQEFFAEIDRIADRPLIHRSMFRDFRRVVLRRFPYLIYFKMDDDAVILFLLSHSARDPATIRQMLRSR